MDKKKYAILFYIAVNIIIIAVIGLLDPNLKDIGRAFNTLKLHWLAGAAACMLMFWVMDALILRYSLAAIFEPRRFKGCMEVALIGQYYNAVTPFASGGQPAQVYYMSRFGIPAGYSTSALIIKYLVYQVVLSIFCAIAFIFKASLIFSYPFVVVWISLIGFVINAGAVFFIYSLSLNRGFIRKIVLSVLKFFHRVRIVRDLEKWKARMEAAVEDFHRSLCMFRGNYKGMALMAVMTAMQLIFYFSVTFFIYRAFGLKDSAWMDMIFVQSFLYLAVSYFPAPGAMGASEGGFYLFFQRFFPGHLIFVAMLLWRFMTYYLNIIVGGLVILARSIKDLSRIR
ncbi:MAG: lysylphosphatidylglycerol synthase transmembrane domain-containing protein [Caldicoprobacter oshimai]|nr:MAG: hypothetical protein DIU64_06705 [Caldicoprobacter oshimai]